MTPKEKARELVEKYHDEFGMLWYLAKQCALIAVDEILNQFKTPTISHIITAYKSAEDFNKNFLDIESQLKAFTTHQILWWQQVKHEINLL